MTTIPADAIYLKKFYEGLRLTAYPDPLSGGIPWTIGFGTTRYEDGSPVRRGDTITSARAESLFTSYTIKNVIPTLAKSIPGWDALTDKQKAALLSFSYNLGENFYGSSEFGTITSVLKEKRYSAMASALLLYRNRGSNVELGLAKRRYAEGLVWYGMNAKDACELAEKHIKEVSDISTVLSKSINPTPPKATRTMTGPKRRPQEFGFKAGDTHLLANDITEKLTAYDSSGKKLWEIPCLCRGQGSDTQWKAPRTDTPPGLYKLGAIYNDVAKVGLSPAYDRTLMAYGWISFDMIDLEGNEDNSGRAGIMIHGGGSGAGWPGAWAAKQPLLPTHGCIRIYNIDLRDKILPLTRQGTVFISVFQE